MLQDVDCPLSDFERDVVVKLLEGEHSVLRELRRQWGIALTGLRQNSGAGFFRNFTVPGETPLQGVGLVLGGVHISMPELEHGGEGLLFVRDGKISFLDCVSIGDDGWPEKELNYTLYQRSPSSWREIEDAGRRAGL